MKHETAHAAPQTAELEQKSMNFAGMVFKSIWIIPTAAFFIVLLFLALRRIHISQTGSNFLIALTYSALIALPSMLSLTWVSLHCTSRFPRSIVLIRAVILLFTATAGSLASGVIIQVIGLVPRGEYWNEFWSSYSFSVVITMVIGLSISSYETMRYKLQETTIELRTRQVEQERAYKLLAEARLSSLESRIHPHFLFNTLNSIAALIPSNPERAEDTVGKLASLLRFSLNAHHSGLVPLSQELKIVRDYLEIEKTRFAERLRYAIEAPEELSGTSVPPLAVQSLVENAVKHVVANRPQGASIEVRVRRADAGIEIAVLDDGPGFSLAAITPEHGLGNLMARLELLFGSAGRLDVAREAEKTIVRISFPA